MYFLKTDVAGAIRWLKDEFGIKRQLPVIKKEDDITFLNLEELLVEAMEENANANPDDLVTYGYDFLDEELGGILKGELVLIGGIAGTGKTTLALKIAEKAAKQGKKVVVITLEERAVERARKMILYHVNRIRRREGKFPIRMVDYLTGKIKLQQQEQIDAYNAIKSKNIEYLVTKKMLTVKDLDFIYKRNADLYVIDHLHYFGHLIEDRSKADSIEESMKAINNLTVNNSTRTLLIAHFQKIDEAKRPTMTNFKDSMSIPQIAKTVIMLWRNRGENATPEQQTITEFICPKNRIDVPTFTSTAEFDYPTNEYKNKKAFMFGTKNTIEPNNFISNNF
jgi:replicative DNA helicase